MNESEHKEGFINIFQGQVGRYIEGLSPATGLYTDEVKECLAVIVYGKKKGKRCFSLVHMDASTPIEILETEKAWMENAAFVVMSHVEEAEASQRVERITSECAGTKITHRYFPKEHDAVFVNFVERDGEELPVISSANSRTFNHTLYNSSVHMELFARYKLNIMLSEIQAQLEMNMIHMMQGDEVEDGEALFRQFQQACGYPKTRLLFDGIRFCSREQDIYYIDCANQFLAEVGEKFKSKPPKLFLEVHMHFMNYFHKKEPYLSHHQLQEQYNETSCELVRIYCYLTKRLDLIKGTPLLSYWIDMVERYSRVIDLPPTKLVAKNSSPGAAVLGASLSKTLKNSGDLSTMVSHILTSDDLPDQSRISNNLG